jgi:phytoene/squalene synthetase
MPERRGAPSVTLAAAMTRAASTQSYLTIRWLADRAYRADAFALYAWFRWLDDTVDERLVDRGQRLTFVARQRDLLARSVDGATTADLSLLGIGPEEALLVGLARSARVSSSGADVDGGSLLLSLRSMLDVMEFDARRRGCAVTQAELDHYTHDLAVAVTEALHHCIGHGCGSPHDESRYVAVTGAHVAHMLRDLAEDLAAGYVNVPADVLDGSASVEDLHTPAMRAWVRDRVELARSCFTAGRQCLAQVENARCRLAGHAYIARFEWVLDAVEGDGYRLRQAYPERATVRGGLTIAADGARSALAGHRARSQRAATPAVRAVAR